MRSTDIVSSLHLRQLAATLTLAVLVVGITISLVFVIDRNTEDGARVNVSGRQRMLSQRIALFATRIANEPPGPDADEHHASLSAAAQQMRRSLAILDETASEAARKVYREPPHALARRTTTFLDHVDAYVDGHVFASAEARQAEARRLSAEAEQLLPILHLAVQIDQASTEANVQMTEALVLAAGLVVLAALFAVWGLVYRPFARMLRRDEQRLAQAEAEAAEEAGRQDFAVALQRAMEMVEDEAGLMQVLTRAFGMTDPPGPLELLLADSSQAHLSQTVVHPSCGGAGCSVPSPRACPAVRRGRTSHFASSDALDACPHLVRDRRDEDPRGAVCVPVAFMGESIGVLHAAVEPDVRETDAFVFRLEQIATATAARVSTIRTFDKVQLQATTDPLTGLLNRRALEAEVRSIKAQGRPFAVALADLDHFKRLNDTFGHDAGDRALATFATLCRETVRGDDLVARFGGEEFVFVFVDCDAQRGIEVLERVRACLREVLAASGGPSFTASFGITDTRFGGVDLDVLVRTADEALLRAKAEGRDRIVVAEPGVPEVPGEASEAPTQRMPVAPRGRELTRRLEDAGAEVGAERHAPQRDQVPVLEGGALGDVERE